MNKMSETKEQSLNRITTGLRTWYESAAAASLLLKEAKETEVWKLKFSSWKEFCEVGCGFSRQWGDRLADTGVINRQIADAASDNSVVTTSATSLANIPILTPAQAAPMKGLPAAKQAEVLRSAMDASGGAVPTVAAIENAVAEAARPTEQTPMLDGTGFPIPAELMPFWERTGEIQKLLSALSTVKGAMEAAQESKDPLYRPVTGGHEATWSGLICGLADARRAIKLAIPFAICSKCQGKTFKSCNECMRRGFVSEHFWNVSVPKEDKAMRAKVLEKKP